MFVSYRGIKLSGKALIVLGGLEIGIVMLLALWSAFDPGPGGFNFEPVNPGNIGDVGANGLYLAVVFGIFSITGWEGACPIAEESENPRSTVPRALILSVLITGSILVIATWFLLLGWGTDNVASIASSSQLPPLDPGRQVLGQRLLDRPAGARQLDARRVHRLQPRRHAHVVLDGQGRRAAEVVRADPSQLQDALECDARAVRVIVGSAVILTWWWGKDNIWFVDGGMITFALGGCTCWAASPCWCTTGQRSATSSTRSLHGLFPIVSHRAMRILWYKSLNPFPAGAVQVRPDQRLRVVGGRVVLVAVLAVTGKEAGRRGGRASTSPRDAGRARHPAGLLDRAR